MLLDRSSRPPRTGVRARLAYITLLASTALPASALSADGVPWRTDFAAAQAEARARNLPLWIQFTGPWCIYCKKMDFETFTDGGVVGRAQGQFIPVKVRSDAREDLVAWLGVGSLPTTVVLSPTGSTILGRRQGFAGPDEFAGILDGAWAGFTNSPEALALSGMCPVKLVQGQGRVAGRADLALFHDGKVYRFADASARDLFLKDPEKYLPADHGRCVVAKKDKNASIPGDPKFGAYYNDRLFVFADEDSRKKFAADPEKYSGIDIAENGECPHCRTVEGKKVAGRREFPITLGGRRYLFADDAHRQAFRLAPERYLR